MIYKVICSSALALLCLAAKAQSINTDAHGVYTLIEPFTANGITYDRIYVVAYDTDWRDAGFDLSRAPMIGYYFSANGRNTDTIKIIPTVKDNQAISDTAFMFTLLQRRLQFEFAK
jgi:hypothetical protein